MNMLQRQRTMPMIRVAVAVLVTAVTVAAVPAADAPTPADVRRKLDQARTLLEAGRPAKARPIVEAAAGDLAALAELPRIPSGVRPLVDLCGELKDDLELEGIDVSGITIPRLNASAGAAPGKPAPAAATPPAKAVSAVSFTRQVAPMLLTHCGGCHVTGRRGDFHMPSYEALMKTGLVQRGAGDASRLVDVIVTGDMPRGGGRVQPQELALLVAWINAGAPFDGPDPAAPLGQGPASATAGATSGGNSGDRMPAAVALKPGDVSFAFQIAPVLQRNCVGCHDDTQPEARLSMTTFARLARGGESGAPFVAGRGADSLLIRKIKGASGIEGQRMPIGKPPLAADVIALVEKWIDQGAKLDMLGPNAPLADLAAAGRARSLSHADLKAARFAAAENLWRRALPDENPAVVRLDDVIVLGNLPQSRLDEMAGSIDKAAQGARALLIDGDGPLLKGGVACLLFAKPYDFSNFHEATTREERPKGMTGDAAISGDVVYGAAIVPSATADGAEDDLTALVAEQVVAAAFLGRGAPAWFARGAGRTVAGKLVAKAAVVKTWRQESAEAVARLGSPEDFFGGHAGAVSQAAVGGGFVSALAPAPTKLEALVARLDAGVAFDAAFAEVFKSPPQPLFATWAAKEARKPAGRR